MSEDVSSRAAASGAAADVWQALDQVLDPEVLRPITELGMVSKVEVSPTGSADVAILLTIAGCPAARKIESETQAAVASVSGVTAAHIDVGVMTPAQRRAFVERVRGDRGDRPQQFGPDSLTRVITVTSGKGGVGKSSLTASLAVALADHGLRVGLIDADVFGFSIPGILGLSRDGRTEQPTRVDDMMLPPVAFGVKVVSIGMFLGDADPRNTAVSWRGPMLHRTIEQFLRDVWFGDLDVLLLDLPPGTGDIAISVGQLLPQAEVLVVTTPQEAAADVAVRSALVARQTGQRVVGVVENMSGFVQPDGSVLEIFGSGGGALVAERLSERTHDSDDVGDTAGISETVPLLGSVPLSPRFRELGDAGNPAVLSAPEDPAAAEILRLAAKLATHSRGLAGRQLGVRPR